jgi:hypothetical protein
VFTAFCPIATILVNVVIKNIPQSLYYKQYVIYSKKIKIQYLNTNNVKLLFVLVFLDLFNLSWALTGIILSSTNNPNSCLEDFGYLAYIGIVFIIIGMTTLLRLIYVVIIFIFGKRIFERYLYRDELINQQEIKFSVFPYSRQMLKLEEE